jgi:hypothetical protein
MLRNPWTSSVVDGPPMFMKTIAVGPFAPGVTWVGATVALPLLHCELYDESTDVAGVVEVARLAARERGVRRAIMKFAIRKKKSSRGAIQSNSGKTKSRTAT